MVDSAPDVPDTGLKIFDEGIEARGRLKIEDLDGMCAAEHCRLRNTLCCERQQAAMRRVLFIQQPVSDAQLLNRRRTLCCERLPEVVPVDPIVDLQRSEGECAAAVGCGQFQVSAEIGCECGLRS